MRAVETGLPKLWEWKPILIDIISVAANIIVTATASWGGELAAARNTSWPSIRIESTDTIETSLAGRILRPRAHLRCLWLLLW